MPLPDLLIVGAPKAGTTALHAALARTIRSCSCPRSRSRSSSSPTARRRPGAGRATPETYREHVWRREDYEALFAAAPAGHAERRVHPASTCTTSTRSAASRRPSRTPGSSRSCVTRSSGPTPTGPTCGRPGWTRSATSCGPAPRRAGGSRPAGRRSGTTRASAGTASSSPTCSRCSPASRCWSSATGTWWTGRPRRWTGSARFLGVRARAWSPRCRGRTSRPTRTRARATALLSGRCASAAAACPPTLAEPHRPLDAAPAAGARPASR